MSRRIWITFAVALLMTACSGVRPLRPTDINVPDGYKIEVAVKDLAAPTMITFDDQGRMLIASLPDGPSLFLAIGMLVVFGLLTFATARGSAFAARAAAALPACI